MRLITSLGLTLILIGAVVIVAPSGTFDSLNADRNIGVETAADEGNAFLGLKANYSGQEIVYEEGGFFSPGTDTSATVATVTNNVNDDWTAVSVAVDSVIWESGADGRVLEVAASPESLSPGEIGTIELECSGDVSGNANDATVALDVSAEGDGNVSVERNAFPVSGVEFNCEGADDPGTEPPSNPVPIGSIDELAVVGTPTAEEGEPFFGSAPNSRVSFTVEYTGTGSATVTAVQLRSTSSSATRVESILGNNREIEIETTDDGGFDAAEGMSIGDTSYPLDQNAAIGTGSTAAITVQEFREGGEFTRVDMAGEDVTVVLLVEGLDSDAPDTAVPVEIELENL
ncbi:hypothetical protein HYG81_09015 [Natrinema zhouii]|uniref:Uncharacterized protein n=1 Tax=Natrinema zhouii TaxID=1710539 RepID=A0A7D6GTI6_9EURY|nr:hypothetical protein [Natrinema zhouii]QLK27723.1 hypothetical protein HYG81_09015 [Natrinema zhouii]